MQHNRLNPTQPQNDTYFIKVIRKINISISKFLIAHNIAHDICRSVTMMMIIVFYFNQELYQVWMVYGRISHRPRAGG